MSIRTNENSQVTIGNEPIREFEKVAYLGCDISNDSDISKEVGIRTG